MRESVSVVIPCYNHGRFLADAIDSVLAQKWPAVEIIVVDDGSTDDTAMVARRDPGVRYVHQPNRGLPAARNTGLRESTGDFLLFLDADDRLVPGAIETNVAWLGAHPAWAFVSGEHRYIDVDGRILDEWTRPVVDTEHYRHLLENNYIGMHATVLYRRAVFDTVGGFRGPHAACADYDLYLRIARRFPIGHHGTTIAEYRRYGTAMSDDLARMLAASVSVLRAQARVVRGHPALEAAYAAGLARWRAYYGTPLARQIGERWRVGDSRRRLLRDALTLLRYAPAEFGRLVTGLVA